VSNSSNLSNLFSPASPAVLKEQAPKSNSLQYLRFQLYPDTKAMLPIAQITEVLKIQLRQIMPIPQMPTWVMGVYNWRGDILWMIDLGQLLGLDSWYQHQQQRLLHSAIVLSPDRENSQSEHQIHLGLMVAGIDDLASCHGEAIQGTVSSTLNHLASRFLTGYWLNSLGEMILALDGQAIAAAMPRTPH
jgi:positive phototaxis protein PixI